MAHLWWIDICTCRPRKSHSTDRIHTLPCPSHSLTAKDNRLHTYKGGGCGVLCSLELPKIPSQLSSKFDFYRTLEWKTIHVCAIVGSLVFKVDSECWRRGKETTFLPHHLRHLSCPAGRVEKALLELAIGFHHMLLKSPIRVSRSCHYKANKQLEIYIFTALRLFAVTSQWHKGQGHSVRGAFSYSTLPLFS